MEKLTMVVALVIGVPICLGISWLVGIFFRSSVLKHDLDKGNKYLQIIISIAIGVFILMIVSAVTEKMGCLDDSDL